MKARRVMVLSLILFALNAWISWSLFTTEYTGQMGSIEGAYIAIARFAAGNWLDLSWFPLWYNGVPYQHTYPPLLHLLVAVLVSLGGMSPALAHHAVTAAFYCLGPVALYWLALRLSGSSAYSLAAGLLYSLVSPSLFLVGGFGRDAGGMWNARRLQVLVQYGEGPHITSLTLLPLAVLLLDVAFKRRRPLWWLLAAMGLASVVLSNWIGGVALLAAVVAWLLASREQARWKKWFTACGVAVCAYVIASPWIPPSTVLAIRASERYVRAPLASAAVRWLFGAAALLVVILMLWAFRRLEVPKHLRFGVLFLFPMALVTLASEWVGVILVPQPHRYHLEMEMGLALVLPFLARVPLARLGPHVRAAVGCALLVACVFPGMRYRKHARALIRPIDIQSTIEFREARWFDENMGGRRVMAPGSVGFFLNAFTDTPQFGGGFDPGAINPFLHDVRFQVLSGMNAGAAEGEVAVLWLKAFGVDSVAVSGPRSKEYYKPFSNPKKFDGLLRELWRDGDDVIYEVPRRNRSLAQVMWREDLPSRPPSSGLDTEPAKRYVAALENPALPTARFQWQSHHEASVTAQLRTEQLVSVQISYHPGWSASVNGRPCHTYGDALGQLVVEPACNGMCRIDLRFDPGLELHLLRWLSLAVLLGGVAWILIARRK